MKHEQCRAKLFSRAGDALVDPRTRGANLYNEIKSRLAAPRPEISYASKKSNMR